MRVAEWNIARRDFARLKIRLRNRDFEVGQRRSADSFQVFDRNGKTPSHFVKISEVFEGAALPCFSSLAVRDMEKCQFVGFFIRDRAGYAGIHAAGNETDCESRSLRQEERKLFNCLDVFNYVGGAAHELR